jgi:transposase-like protein
VLFRSNSRLGQSVAKVSKDLGLSKTALYEWQRTKRKGGLVASNFPGKGCLKPQDEELRRLRRENEVLRRERDILKKAVAGSSARCNKGVKFIKWGTKIQSFSRPAI